MLNFLVIILFIAQSSQLFNQENVLDYETISINGISYKSSYSDLIDVFGDPTKKYDPNYECGQYSKDQPHIKTTELYVYPGLEVLIVNDTVNFEKITFANLKKQFILKSDQIDLSIHTTVEELKAAFPKSYENWINGNKGIFRLWQCSDCDAEIHLTINNGYLKSLDFWSPC